VCPGASFDAVENRKIPCLFQESNTGSLVIQPVAYKSQYRIVCIITTVIKLRTENIESLFTAVLIKLFVDCVNDSSYWRVAW
jgi:hypothetical protein